MTTALVIALLISIGLNLAQLLAGLDIATRNTLCQEELERLRRPPPVPPRRGSGQAGNVYIRTPGIGESLLAGGNGGATVANTARATPAAVPEPPDE